MYEIGRGYLMELLWEICKKLGNSELIYVT